jgi:hypothetical protein
MVILEAFIVVKTSTVLLWIAPQENEENHCIHVADTARR